MTFEQQTQIYLAASSIEEARKICDYNLGREAAQEHIANGRGNLAKQHGNIALVMGENWTRGYTEYYNSWEILNKSPLELAR